MRRWSLLIPAIVLSGWTGDLYGQGCPACSNPALQSSEKLEAGLDTLDKGTFRLTLNGTSGFNYQGGHENFKGLTPEGDIIDVPLHNHRVNLNFVRSELALEYTFKTNWSVWLRVPFDVKMQRASVVFVDPVTQYEREAILRNGNIHHRTENYSGVSDLRLLVSHRFNHFLSKRGRLDLAVGTSVPSGKTEDDPLEAKASGIEHMHIQFGTGTFDPLVEAHYSMSLTKWLSMALFSINKVSFYKNRRKYQGPFETTNGISFGFRAAKWFIPRLTFANYSQRRAKWNGVNDPNSGLISFNLTGNLTFKVKDRLTISPAFRQPVSQRTLDDEGDTFEYGPTFLLNISCKFSRSK